MKDLNFFDNYIENRELKISKKITLFIFLAIFFLTLLVYGIGNQVKIIKLSSQVNSLKILASNPDRLKLVSDVNKQEDEVNQFKIEVEQITDLNLAIENGNIINEDLLKMITHSKPESIFLNIINILQNEIYIGGVSKDKWSIAEFGKGIEYIDNVNKVFISNISKNEDHYNFDLNITFRGGIENGEDQ